MAGRGSPHDSESSGAFAVPGGFLELISTQRGDPSAWGPKTHFDGAYFLGVGCLLQIDLMT